MALETVELYVDAARSLLLDETEPYRYSDEVLILGLNLGLLEARRIRPDLFIGVTTVPTYEAGDTVVFDQQYRVSLLYYMVGNAQLHDDEDTRDARAGTFLTKFVSQMSVIQS